MNPPTTPDADKPRRTWHYLLQPKDFQIAPCTCGNHETQWSEFQKHLWCDRCEIDFLPEHNGVFEGPILPRVCAMMGIIFDRFNMDTQQVEVFDLEGGSCDWIPQPPVETQDTTIEDHIAAAKSTAPFFAKLP